MNDYVHEVSDEEVARIQRFGYSAAIGTAIFIVLIILAIVTAQYWVKLISHEGERQFISPHVKWVNEHLLDESDPALQALFARFTASDNCAVDSTRLFTPPLFPSACGAGATTPVTWVATDSAGYQAFCASVVTVLRRRQGR